MSQAIQSKYSWLITWNNLDCKKTQITGPSNCDEKEALKLELHPHAKSFKMYDDDGEHYFTGKYLGPDGEQMFGPLDDFGRAYGCTEIWYWDAERHTYVLL